MSDPLVARVTKLVDAFNLSLPLTQVRVWLTDPATKTFTYRVAAVDSRVFTQTIKFGTPPTPEPIITYTAPNGWKGSEFARMTGVRVALVALISRGTDLLEYRWDA